MQYRTGVVGQRRPDDVGEGKEGGERANKSVGVACAISVKKKRRRSLNKGQPGRAC